MAKILQINYGNLGNPFNIWNFLTITLHPEMLANQSRALKTCIIALNPIKFWAT